MLEIRPSLPEEWNTCRAFWLEGGAVETELDKYYVNHYAPERVIPLWDDEVLSGLLVWTPIRLRWADGGETGGACLLTVLGEGYQDILLSYAEFYLGARAIPALTAACDLGRAGWLSGFQPGELCVAEDGPVPVQQFFPRKEGETGETSAWFKRLPPPGLDRPCIENA